MNLFLEKRQLGWFACCFVQPSSRGAEVAGHVEVRCDTMMLHSILKLQRLDATSREEKQI